MASIGMSCNFYREPNAIHGLLETASKFFDDLLFVSAPPPGAAPDDETISIIQKWGARIVHSDISSGFGVVRNICVQNASTEWVMILDADERFHPTLPVYSCEGTEGYPQVVNPHLVCTIRQGALDQGALLKGLINRAGNDILSIRMSRRHWFDFSGKRPTQNWEHIADWQHRCLRNNGQAGFDVSVKMHERAIDFRSNNEPAYLTGDQHQGPFFDHYHCFFKPMEAEQRKEDISIYDSLCK